MCSISIPLCAQSYERRSKAIKGIKEAKYWSDISADMMSEEEKVDDQYVRHPPLYRSERLNKFVHKLDHRLSKCLSDRPRITRVLGSPHKALPPINAKKWTVNHARTSSRRIFDTPDAVCHGYSRINDEEEEEEDQEEEDEQLPGMSSDSEFSTGDSE